ncbi:kynurenine/alpha-aminoadipate aminotransferase, mitochondrial-like [Penaeus japonicus]|uniref:kynurenine/alpha-aminoadipate aminotransferase, mitochondrial-like n=1 Tax=Penaeus japonicus TaxID=27405 RepID=UPI001C7134B2|nr:kynurenine/alpha-aminoadipate aminotransferase, mitochondrial-like [Penaeus japonicus]
MDYSKYLSVSSSNRKPSGISEMQMLLTDPSPSLVWLASGMPNPQQFPFCDAAINLSDGSVLEISKEVMATGLQYGPTPGYVPLIEQLKEMTLRTHNPPRWTESDLLVTVGCQDGLAKAVEMLFRPRTASRKTRYPDALCILAPLKLKYVIVTADERGMCPVALKKGLEEARLSGGPVPKVLYLVPTACNPTGITIDEARRREIYSIASEYDLIILEDDPYLFLQYDEEPMPPSFLRLDTEGRVLRFDSFSKIVSAGLRVGFVTGPAPLIERINWHMQASVLCPPGISQVMVSELLRKWGDDGFKKHVGKLRDFYKAQRDVMLRAVEEHLTGLCEWTVPKGGIYIWFKVPGLHDTTPMLVKRAVLKGVVLVPGKDFMVDDKKQCQYMRAAFSCATKEQMWKGMEKLAELIREEMALQQDSQH